ncbi:hypothetical protein RAH32_09300 [Paracoccus sp. WLY502]|nr:hypothetical protein [Paracoccus sp. WLY502]MDQ1900634.1 hypothetical protein [Paracoccus sp. WLY502]
MSPTFTGEWNRKPPFQGTMAELNCKRFWSSVQGTRKMICRSG